MPNLITVQDLSPGYLINDDYRNLTFNDVKHSELLELPVDLSIQKARRPHYLYLKLKKAGTNDDLSLLRLKKIVIHNDTYYSVDKSNSFIKGKGYAQYLYEYSFIYLKYPVISDKTQTMPGSAKLWKKFHENQNSKHYTLYIINENTYTISPYINRNFNDYDIWGWHPDFINLLRTYPEMLEDGLKDGDLSEELYHYLNDGWNKVKDRAHIRLIGRKK
ncbi:MAG TPA: hypothetical protein PKN44_11670 [Bacteroidales bacterium]|nr:hypothetical protein [Bacteroidales bacterium]